MVSSETLDGVEVGLLGPLEIRRDGREVAVAGARLRALLCRLAAEAGRPVPSRELVDAVWPDGAPGDPANALQSLVSRLRRVLAEPDRVRQDAAGYRLVLGADELDVTRFGDRRRRAAERSQHGNTDAALADLAEALALWRGEPLADAGDADYRTGYAARWEADRLAAVKAFGELALRAGTADPAAGVVAEVLADHPFDEGLAAVHLRLLAAAGRTPEALTRYEQTRRLLRDELGSDPSPELRDLHLQLLRGGPDPARAADAGRPDRSNLRSWLTSFVGRERDVERVQELLRDHRLTTVVGPGGAGKTRLAVEAARSWLAEGGESAWLVELAPVTDGAGIATAVLDALGLREAKLLDRTERSTQDTLQRLVEVLHEASCLLVVDNCEHLVDAAAAVVEHLLAVCPGVRVLATSREPLALTAEALVPLAPLVRPPAATGSAAAADYPAVRLWLDRARAVQPGFALDQGTLGPVVEIVRRLDGLPLAIELAAARLRVLPVAEIASRLSDRFRLLTGGNRTSLPRHRTLRAVVAWSWDLLSPEERLLAERLAVFPAGADVGAAQAVCGDDRLDAAAVDDLLLALVDKSLLQVDTAGVTLRFRMLETIREYGVERLAERNELEQSRLAHARYFADLAVRLEPELRARDQLAALAALNLERENILSALRFLCDSGRGVEALHLALALVWYWMLLDSPGEAAAMLGYAVAANDDPDAGELVFARAGLVLAEMTSTLSSEPVAALDGVDTWAGTQARIERVAEELLAAPAPPFVGLEALRPMLAVFAGRLEIADELTTRSLRTSTDPWLRAALLSSLAGQAENEGDLPRMREAVTEAYATFAALGDRWGLSTTLVTLARLSTLEGRTADAVAEYEEASRHVVALGSSDDDLYIRLRLADLYARLGDLERARDQLLALQAPGALPGGNREREMFAGAALAGLEWRAGEVAAAEARLVTLRRWLAEHRGASPLLDHARAIVLGTAGAIAAAAGRVEDAAEDLTSAYAAGVLTTDMPILATVGRATAQLALALAQPAEAATVLGASAQVLGSDDESDPDVRSIRAAARAGLGEAFDQHYRAGRTLTRAEAVARLDPALLGLPTAQARAR
ncbi:BTAD domain-containing putative transcriptional regulator [uncultured Friedmanniella sp.]|uniref:AfsR/SARP family transcriptional regulator n=1 Tax=uncultured Friedmanniella sp. TaxID=335381 RepID=UPI0035CAFBC2